MIPDIRVANCFFRKPSHTSLPTTAALSSLECNNPDELYFSGGDIECAFYWLSVPSCARRFLTLPKVKAKFVNVESIDGMSISPNTYLTPQLEVLPMGWSWSLFLCQRVHEVVAGKSGFDSSSAILDRHVPKPSGSHDVQHAEYVDNFLIAGHNPATVGERSNSHSNTLDTNQLLCHDFFGPTTTCTFVGLEFDGVAHTVRVGSHRAWRLRLALDFVLDHMKEISGAQLEVIIGHLTWTCLVRREPLVC